MVRFRRGFGDGEVEAVKLFLARVETSSGGARAFELCCSRRAIGRRRFYRREMGTYL